MLETCPRPVSSWHRICPRGETEPRCCHGVPGRPMAETRSSHDCRHDPKPAPSSPRRMPRGCIMALPDLHVVDDIPCHGDGEEKRGDSWQCMENHSTTANTVVISSSLSSHACTGIHWPAPRESTLDFAVLPTQLLGRLGRVWRFRLARAASEGHRGGETRRYVHVRMLGQDPVALCFCPAVAKPASWASIFSLFEPQTA